MGGGRGQELKEGEGEKVEIIEVFADMYQYSASTFFTIVLRGYNAQHTSAIVIFSYSMRRLAMQMCALLTRRRCLK